jgi:predicted XRE-type DNA-binding protein
MSNPEKVTASSGNVFADLGFANPEAELLKARLVREIRAILKRRKLTRTRAAAMLGLKQPGVSALVTGRVGKFSIDRLVRCLDRLAPLRAALAKNGPGDGAISLLVTG